MKTRRVIYLAHCLSAPDREGIEANRKSAARWAAFLVSYFHVAVECSWIVLTGELEETPVNRERGLECDLSLVERCRDLVMVGPRISEGMLLEAKHMVQVVGGPVYDLTGIPRDQDLVAKAWKMGRWFP